jgi:hypothetical protein
MLVQEPELGLELESEQVQVPVQALRFGQPAGRRRAFDPRSILVP